ncbi:MAG: pyridoxal phosphate-dependent aminotransferase [Deltaproteobacteria bacterium]|nr:pyridoxal phosphate-dependent aminotransferase [Deltaproteobacteria bacterium]
MALSLNIRRMNAVRPSATLAMAAKAKALQKSGVDVANLSAGEPDFKTPDCIVDYARRALDDRAAHAYTNARGTDELVDAMRAKLKREQYTDYAVSEVIATVGTKGALMLAIDALVGEGDEVVLFAPYWVTYADLVRLAGGTPVVVRTRREHGYRPSPADLEQALSPRTKLVVLCSPSNPTGAGWPEELLRTIYARLRGTDTWVISDEIYERLTYGAFRHVSPVSFDDDARSRTLWVGGVAKAYAMTGWRVGVAAGPKLLVDAMITLQQQRTTCAAAVAQAAAAYALRESPDVTAAVEHMRTTYEKRRALVLERCARLPGVQVHPPDGAFYVFLDLSKRLPGIHKGRAIADDVKLSELLLEEAHVALVPGTAFDGPGCLRLSYAASESVIEQGFDRLERFLADIT